MEYLCKHTDVVLWLTSNMADRYLNEALPDSIKDEMNVIQSVNGNTFTFFECLLTVSEIHLTDGDYRTGQFASVRSYIEDTAARWLERRRYYTPKLLQMSVNGHIHKVSVYIGTADNPVEIIPMSKSEFNTEILDKPLRVFRFI